jgi:hypothetical protein
MTCATLGDAFIESAYGSWFASGQCSPGFADRT